MSLNQIPLSGGKPETNTVEISVARTAVAIIASPVDGTDLRRLFTAGLNGGFYDSIEYQVAGTGTQASFNIYVWETDNAGANAKMIRGYTIGAGSAMGATVIGQKGVLSFVRADLQTGVQVWISQSVVSASCVCNYTIRAGQFETQTV
jgi:hypothetical protein